MRLFFLISSIVAGAAFTVGSTEAAKVIWLALGIIALVVLWARKTKIVEKAPVPTEYSEAEIREIYSALSVAKSSAPFRQRNSPSHDDMDPRF